MAAEYNKGKDFISSLKMNFFHHFLKQLTGYLLHPSIELSGDPCRIADMGTQTAIWASDVAEDARLNAKVDAFDLSDKFFPPRPWLPANLELRLQDVGAPFTADHLGKYDVVHFRLFLTLTSEKLTQLIENAITLLRPGGYIQWVEHDKTNLKAVKASPDASTEAVDAFIELQQNPFPNYRAAWVNDIAPTLASKGMNVVAEDRVQTRPSMSVQINDLHLLSLVDVPAGLSSAVDNFKEKYFDVLASDSQKQVSLLDTFRIVVAQKPA